MNRLLFLDVDGVLNGYTRSYGKPKTGPRSHWDLLEPDCIALLKSVIEATGCRVVLSSTWRKDKRAPAMFAQRFKIRISGVTGTATETIGNTTYHSCRGREILNYLDEFGQVESYAVIDDEMADIEDLIPADRIAHVKDHDGMLPEHAARLIAILQTPLAATPAPYSPASSEIPISSES